MASPCFRAFPVFWNVAHARDEISLVNVLVLQHICAPLDGALVAKNALCWQQCFFTHRIKRVWANVFNG